MRLSKRTALPIIAVILLSPCGIAFSEVVVQGLKTALPTTAFRPAIPLAQKQLFLKLISLASHDSFFAGGQSTEQPTEQAPKTASSGSSETACLDCHGPFEALTSAPASFEAGSSGKVNPHRYVPHDSKTVPECSSCHQPHQVPIPSKEEIPKPNVDWCYAECHHQRDFTSCKQCHV
jgi:hypothetical protein